MRNPMMAKGIDEATTSRLVKEAKKVRENAHAPYSDYKVGAAILASSGKIYRGCNIENSSYGMTVCAERVALGCAISNGEKELTAIAIVTDDDPPATPCGACRQVLSEFQKNLIIISANLSGQQVLFRLSDLIPHPFQLG
jgi:cytidine deaminase